MKIIDSKISNTWLKASVMGSIWATNEILLGSFLHNLRIPLSGTFMAFLSVAIIVSFSILWKDKGLIIKAGLIAALMKSISPSAIILGPMVGIILEAAFLQFFVLIFGRTLFGFAVGGAFAVAGVLFQKVGRLLISYGVGFLDILDNLYKYAVYELGLSTENPEQAVLILVLFYAFWGVVAAFIGYFAGKKALQLKPNTYDFSSTVEKGNLFEKTTANHYSIYFLTFHIVALVLGMYIINTVNFWISPIYVALYIVLVISKYRQSLKRLRKPAFWIWLVGITFFATYFLDNTQNQPGLSIHGLIAGLLMNLRAAMVLFSFTAISTELKNPIIKSIMYQRGAASFYQSLELAFGILPAVTELFPGAKVLIKKPVGSIIAIINKADIILNFVSEKYKKKSKVLIITGDRQEGKTTFVKWLIKALHKKNPQGFYTEVEKIGEERFGYYLVPINQGKRRLLCSIKPETGSIKYGKFYFDKTTFEMGSEIIQGFDSTKSGLFVVDEIGPLELSGEGWASALEDLIKKTETPMIWTVRRSLAEKVARRWNVGTVGIVDITEENIEKQVLQFLM